MAEDRGGIAGQQLQQRLEKLANQWSQGKVTLKQIVGLSDDEGTFRTTCAGVCVSENPATPSTIHSGKTATSSSVSKGPLNVPGY